MKAKCRLAVERALGRPLSAAEERGIEDRITRAVKRMARAKPEETMRLGTEERLRQAAKIAAKDLLADAKRAQRNMKLQLEALGRVADYVDAQAARGMSQVDALSRVLAPKLDGRDRIQSVETRTTAIRREASARLSAEIEALGPKFLGLFENPEGGKLIVRELKGEATGNAAARTFAEKWREIATTLRERFNDAGGKIRYLEDWAFPQAHSQELIAHAGLEKWGQFVMPLLDRRRYFDEAGRPMSDDAFRVFVETAWRTLASGGLLGEKSGTGRSAMVANRHAAARELHFRSADAYLAYHERFGAKSIMATLRDHVDNLARDLALVEVLGPNPEHAFDEILHRAMQAEVEKAPQRKGAIDDEAAGLQNLYNEVAGAYKEVASQQLARGFNTLRNWLVATRLGSAVITSFSDEATMRLTAHLNNLPEMQLLRNELKLMNPANVEDRRILRRAGLGLETLIGSINRAGQEHLFDGMSSRVATFSLRASGLNFLTDARRQAFGATMMDALGSLTRTVDSLAKLDATDHRILLSKGITETDWQVWRKAEPERWGAGNGLLTPEAILKIPDAAIAHLGEPAAVKREAVLKLLGAVSEEVDMAVVAPGARERAFMHGTNEAGTWKGELARSFWLFKSFPVAMIMRHWRRAMEVPATGKAWYLAALMAGTTLLGALSLELNELLSGRDPKNLNPFEGKAGARNLFAAMIKGGSLGIYGDFLYSESTQGERGAVATLLGPVAGLGEELIGLTQGNVIQALQGKDTRAGAELIRFARGLTPAANLWYAKAALDHLVLHNLQELASPGYLRNMQSRAQREFGQEFFWQPGERWPARAPRLEAIGGK